VRAAAPLTLSAGACGGIHWDHENASRFNVAGQHALRALVQDKVYRVEVLHKRLETYTFPKKCAFDGKDILLFSTSLLPKFAQCMEAVFTTTPSGCVQLAKLLSLER